MRADQAATVEELAYDLRAVRRATLIGETTGGGAHPVQRYKVSITKTNWEGTGVSSDIAVDALDRAYHLALDRRGAEGGVATAARLGSVAPSIFPLSVKIYRSTTGYQ